MGKDNLERPAPLNKPLPGSQYLRGYCSSCKEPMRVTHVQKTPLCSTCCGEATVLAQMAEPMKNRNKRKKFKTTE